MGEMIDRILELEAALKPFADAHERMAYQVEHCIRQDIPLDDFVCSELHPAYHGGKKLYKSDFEAAFTVMSNPDSHLQ